MKLQRWSLMLAASALIAFTAQANTMMRPGLWEHTTNVKTQSGEMEKSMKQMQQQMASMPPEQRKMMESMMASQGVSMGAKGNSVQVCVTQKEAELDIVPRTDSHCTHKVTRRSANSVWFKFNCGGPNPSHGEGEFTFQHSKSYTGKMTVYSQNGGQNETVNMQQSGKWLSDNCGKIKPLAR